MTYLFLYHLIFFRLKKDVPMNLQKQSSLFNYLYTTIFCAKENCILCFMIKDTFSLFMKKNLLFAAVFFFSFYVVLSCVFFFLQLNFVGVTVEPERPYVHFHSNKHTFLPMPVGQICHPKQVRNLICHLQFCPMIYIILLTFSLTGPMTIP